MRTRHKQILDYLEEHAVVTVKQLVELLQCSPATVRRDIVDLDAEGKLKKIRNGAERVLSPTSTDSPGLVGFYPQISDFKNYEECDRIAQKAVDICQDKDNIFIGEGQTTFLMGKHLLQSGLHVYSNYLPLVTYLISKDYPHLVVLGGQYVKSQHLLVAPDTHVSYQGRYMFVSGDGLTESGLTKSSLLAFMEEKKMLNYADKVIALVDSTNIGVFGGISLFGLDQLDIVITGSSADPDIVAALQAANVQVFLV